MGNWHEGEAQRQADAANDIASNGGTGSIEYWNAVISERTARTNAQLHEESMNPPGPLPDYSVPPLSQPYAPGSGYGGGACYSGSGFSLGRNGWLAVAVAALSALAGWQWHKSHVLDPDYVMEESIFLSPDVSLGSLERNFTPQALKKEQAWAAKRFGETYGKAYKPGTDFMSSFSCSNAPSCLNIFPQNLERLRKQALDPENYWDNLCSIDFMRMNSENARLMPVKPKFALGVYKLGKQTWSCKMVNAKEVKSALAAANAGRLPESAGVGALACAALGAMAWPLRRRKKADSGAEGKAQA